jgi:hypothetical protein
MNPEPSAVLRPLSSESRPRTAVLISGHMRTFARVFSTIQWHVLRHFPDADFFVSTVADRDSASAELLRERYPKARVEIDVVAAQPELPIPVAPFAQDWTLGRMYGHEPYTISVHPQAILRQLWQLQRCWEFFAEKAGNGITRTDGQVDGYDTIVRLRPDLWFRSFELPGRFASFSPTPASAGGHEGGEKRGQMPGGEHAATALTPWWGRFGGVNDRFAILGPAAAQAYFTTYSRLPELLAAGCPLHPESLVKASLEAARCRVNDTLLVEFSKLYGPENPKLNGTFRDPEITSIDIAHLGAKGVRP